ncbi:MAG TPA: kelch repeat-containing protein [Bryobacteraceae bacterium]|nr:kelch repeat-containing protein [Bryobacteraceae bacterium]
MALAQSQDRFTPTGDMTAQRMGHTATLLTNGKVLVTGGYAVPAGFPVWASAELYDPLTGKFALTGSMTTPRAGHTATLLPDGKVLIAGGFVSNALGSLANIVATAELYDPFTSTFTATGAMTAPRQGHTASLLNNGKVLITGGQRSDLTTLQSSAEVYDPLTGAFTSTGGMAAARAWHVATLLPNGRVLIEGGASCDGQPTPELYDPVAGQFSLTGPSTYPPHGGLSAVSASPLPNGNILTILNVGCDVFSGAELYDAAKGVFTSAAGMSASRGYTTATLLAEGSVLIAGRDFDFSHRGGSAELYDPAAGTFTAVDGTPQREELHTATLLPDGSVLLAGGWICCGFSVSTAEIYHPVHPAPSPVLYSLPGASQGAILHAGTHEVVSPGNPAVQGEALEMYGAGLIEGGAIPPQVSIGGRLAEVLFFGEAPGYSGLGQINVRVPSGIAPGPAVPVRLSYLGRSSNEVTVGVK